MDLNGNTEHVTCHGVSPDEIMQVFANKPRISRNRDNRSAGYSAFGRTDGGRPVRVNRYDPANRSARPISAWEDR
ncbi:MAG: hypothetical protein M3308_07990 [Actinomycetota bacterium]|nr:hypothetical protein [Actinomycetota bacterium]